MKRTPSYCEEERKRKIVFFLASTIEEILPYLPMKGPRAPVGLSRVIVTRMTKMVYFPVLVTTSCVPCTVSAVPGWKVCTHAN